MKIYILPRQSGKTTKMIEWLRKDPKRIMITFSYENSKLLARQNPDLAGQFIDINSYMSDWHMRCRDVGGVAVDNADEILQIILKTRIEEMTMTSGDQNVIVYKRGKLIK